MALAILVAITAVVLPVIAFRLDEQRLADLRERVPAALGLAQLDAMRLGEAVEVWLISAEDGAQRLVGRIYGGESQPEAADADDPATPETVYLRVPRGFRARLAGSDGDGIAAASEELAGVDDGFVPPPMPGDLLDDEASTAGGASEQLLAVFLPDGSAFVAKPWEIVMEQGVGVLIEVSPWTGRATVIDIARADSADGGAGDGAGREPLPVFGDDEPMQPRAGGSQR